MILAQQRLGKHDSTSPTYYTPTYIYIPASESKKLIPWSIVRLFVKRGMSIKYLLPNPVIDYIHAHGLYLPPLTTAASIEDPIQRK